MKRRALAMVALSAVFFACAAEKRAPAAESGRALLEAYVAAWNQHDSTAFDTLLAPDAVHEDLAQRFTGRGPAEIKDFMRELIKAEPDFVWTLTKFVEASPMIAAEWTWTATYTGPSPNGPVSGMRISGRGASVAEIADGKIKRLTDYYDIASYFAPPAADSAKK